MYFGIPLRSSKEVSCFRSVARRPRVLFYSPRRALRKFRPGQIFPRTAAWRAAVQAGTFPGMPLMQRYPSRANKIASLDSALMVLFVSWDATVEPAPRRVLAWNWSRSIKNRFLEPMMKIIVSTHAAKGRKVGYLLQRLRSPRGWAPRIEGRKHQ